MSDIKKEKYDYYCNDAGLTIVTICYILTAGGIVGRGMAIRSKQDAYDNEIGKPLAKKHALRAIKGRHLDSIKRKEVIGRLIQCKCPFAKKGERNPELSWWERRFLFGAKNMSKYADGIGFCPFMSVGEKGAAAGARLRLKMQGITAGIEARKVGFYSLINKRRAIC